MNLPYDDDRTWQGKAACAKTPTPDVFFPPRNKELYRVQADEAKTYCFGGTDRPPCPVRLNCLWQAVYTDELHGIWGGLSHRERNALLRKWQRKYKKTMTLKEFIFLHNKEKEIGNRIERGTEALS
jgi:WhiB family redox-sensing transcriptional regulator